VRTASVDDLARWIETERPTVQEVVDATGGEPDLARKLLEAESQATDQDPRKGVLDGLSAVIARG
jgi:organic radical activating enzyme